MPSELTGTMEKWHYSTRTIGEPPTVYNEVSVSWTHPAPNTKPNVNAAEEAGVSQGNRENMRYGLLITHPSYVFLSELYQEKKMGVESLNTHQRPGLLTGGDGLLLVGYPFVLLLQLVQIKLVR